MSKEIIMLMWTAASIGFIHTLFGPDHYLPFIVMSKARNWSRKKTALITFVCGLGHILSSVVLGFIGISFGIAVMKLEAFEGMRGTMAGWMLLIFGFTYFIWGLHQVIRNKPHKHIHVHEDNQEHTHEHTHSDVHTHVHDHKKSITPWVLFTIFVFGPCEPLIPILMYPAMAKGSLISVALVAGVFTVATLGTMMTMVMVSSYGLARVPFGRLSRYSHALAGLAILLCGVAINFLGL